MDAARSAPDALVLGKLSGRHALRNPLEELGYTLDDEELKRAFVASRSWPTASGTSPTGTSKPLSPTSAAAVRSSTTSNTSR